MSVTALPTSTADLAHEPDFTLGGLMVSPSACLVRWGDRELRVEPKIMEVLLTLARASPRTVTRDQLVEACWGGRFISDDALNRVISKVRALSRGFDPRPFTLETVPKVGFRLIAPQAADDGSAEARPTGPIRRRLGLRRRSLVVLAGLAAVLVAAASWTAWERFAPGRPVAPAGRIDVMLFEPLQPDPDLQRFSVALGDEVVRLLARSGVETTRRPLRRDAAASVGADYTIAGTVDRDADRYVVNAQILDSRSRLVLWSGRTDRPASNATGFAADAAHHIASFVPCAMEERAAVQGRMSPAVLGMFLEVCSAASEMNHPRLIDVTRRLVQAAPDHPGAHSMHALAAGAVAERPDLPVQEAAELRALARQSADRALKLDRRNAKAHLAMAFSYGRTGHWKLREHYTGRALALAPDLFLARIGHAELLLDLGRLAEAREVVERAVAADPRAMPGLEAPVVVSAIQGDMPVVEAHLARMDAVRPEFARRVRAVAAFWWEDPKTALPKIRRINQGLSREANLVCYDRYLERLVNAPAGGLRGLPDGCDQIPPHWRMRMLARQGDIDGAYAEIANRAPSALPATAFLFYPELKALRRDPRFMPLAKQLGLVDYWLETDRWPDFCAEPDLPYDCRAVARSL